jgi:hypothetical protein
MPVISVQCTKCCNGYSLLNTEQQYFYSKLCLTYKKALQWWLSLLECIKTLSGAIVYKNYRSMTMTMIWIIPSFISIIIKLSEHHIWGKNFTCKSRQCTQYSELATGWMIKKLWSDFWQGQGFPKPPIQWVIIRGAGAWISAFISI